MEDFYKLIQSDEPTLNFTKPWLYCLQPGLKKFKSNDWSGKWCIQRNARTIDKDWKVIKKLASKWQITAAKVSTSLISGIKKNPDYLIIVYTNDWRNREDIDGVRSVLFASGFSEKLKYKRDIETKNGIYGEGEFFIVE